MKKRPQKPKLYMAVMPRRDWALFEAVLMGTPAGTALRRRIKAALGRVQRAALSKREAAMVSKLLQNARSPGG
mgnify:CR=1 FL=1